MEHNPYAPPSAAVADQVHVPEDDELASRLQRFLNYLIDAVFRVLLLLLVGVVAGLTGWGGWILSLNTLESVLFTWSCESVYYVFCESIFGWTIGKLITRTRVVAVTGEAPKFGQILGRTLCRLIPFEAFSFFGAFAVGWHDSFSNTRVIRVSRHS